MIIKCNEGKPEIFFNHHLWP